MVARFYPPPHRFVCFTDDATGIDAAVEVLPLWSDFADVPNPSGRKQPSCYRRLKLFAPEMREVLGDRFVAIDLDTVITGDLRPLWNRTNEFVIFGDTHPSTPYNGSMFLMTAGARAQVWTEFDPATSPARAAAARFRGSDQAWISYCLGPREARWTRAEGVYSFRNDLRRRPTILPANAKVIFWHGKHDPWAPLAQTLPWVRRFYR